MDLLSTVYHEIEEQESVMEFLIQFILEGLVTPVVDHIGKGNRRFEKFLRILTVVFIIFIIAAMIFSIGYLIMMFIGLEW